MQTNRRKFFAVAAAATVATIVPKSEAQLLPVVSTATIVRLNGSTVGLFSTLTDAHNFVAQQTKPTAYNVEVWPITPAGQSTPLNSSNT